MDEERSAGDFFIREHTATGHAVFDAEGHGRIITGRRVSRAEARKPEEIQYELFFCIRISSAGFASLCVRQALN
jgi:hypothetical protein